MPYAAPRFCPVPGCPELTDGQRCEAHRNARHASIDARRKSPHQRGYDSAWQRLRRMKLAADPWCQIRTHCVNKPLIHRLATEVDHILPIRQRPDLRLVWSNLQSSCHACHSAKSLREMKERNSIEAPELQVCEDGVGAVEISGKSALGTAVHHDSRVREIRIGGGGDED